MRTFRKNLLLLLVVVASITTASAVDKEKGAKFTPPSIESISAKQTSDAVTIAVKPYDTEALAKTAYGKLDPNKYGVLPVLVMIRNDSKGTIRLSEMKVEYIDASRDRIESTPASEVKYSRSPKRPSYGPGPIPGIRLKGKNPLEAEEIEIRGFSAKMLPPGESAHGFVYFRTGHRPGSHIYITDILDAASGKELLYFDIPLD